MAVSAAVPAQTAAKTKSRPDRLRGSGRPVLHRLTLADHARLRRLARLEDVADAEVVDRTGERRSDQGPDDRYPEVVVDIAVVARHRLAAPARDPREHPRSEVSGGVDGVAGVGAEGDADRHHDHAHHERRQVGSDGHVELIGHRPHEQSQEERPDDLVDQWPQEVVEIGCRERGKRAVGGLGCRGALDDVIHLVKVVDRVVVDQEHQGGPDEGAQHLRDPIAGNPAPRQLLADRGTQRDCGVDVRPGDPATDVDGEGDGQRPSPGDEEPITRGLERAGGAAAGAHQSPEHRHHAVSEADQDESAEELRPILADHSGTPAKWQATSRPRVTYGCHAASLWRRE